MKIYVAESISQVLFQSFLNASMHANHLEIPLCAESVWAGLGEDLRLCISTKLPGFARLLVVDHTFSAKVVDHTFSAFSTGGYQ